MIKSWKARIITIENQRNALSIQVTVEKLKMENKKPKLEKWNFILTMMEICWKLNWMKESSYNKDLEGIKGALLIPKWIIEIIFNYYYKRKISEMKVFIKLMTVNITRVS